MDTKSKSTDENEAEQKKHRLRAAAFLGTVGGLAALIGFSKTLANAKKEEHKILEQNGLKAIGLLEGGSALAMRALAWGTFYAVLGTGTFCYSVWKLSGAQNFQEFRQKMGSGLPRLTKDKSLATSETEFNSLTDLMKYLSTWSEK